MITDSELKISNESYLHKDFAQIYPEILELVNKITDRWMPSAESNESDPGVVLLKLLAFIADKNNYNIDKNILECFMPSATQEDSMRKLCDMMGYSMHYYKSAETEVSFMWTSTKLESTANESTGSIILPAFTTVLTDDSQEVSYVLIDPVTLTHRNDVQSGTAIEGTLCEFEINDDNIVKSYNLDDNLRLYFPESHVAENGVWIYNEEDKDSKKNPWARVTNLNTQLPDTKVWKFGYDSKKKLPYIQFPSDVVELLNEGLSIYYVRTSGESGNVSAKALTTLANATSVTYYSTTGESEEVDISVDNNNYLTIQNASASINGTDVESLDDAYNNFKKTVGTFDTLVTCRDYANAIYNLLDDNNNPYVSNVIVSDIKDNLNFCKNIITLDAYGCHNILVPNKDDDENDEINHFDLYILPFKPITTSYTSKTFQNSFKPTAENYYDIINELENYKNISHEYKTLDSITNKEDIYCLKNKYELKATITTTYKVNASEQKQILNNVYTALYKNFNARKIDFGEEIPYDSVLSVIENADTRIKVVILDDFTIRPVVMLASGNEYYLTADKDSFETTNKGWSTYRELVAKNVLAGKLPLFNYDDSVEYKYGEATDEKFNEIIGGTQSYTTEETGSKSNSITYVTTKLTMNTSIFKDKSYELTENQSIQFIAPAYTSIITYPAYTNYYANIGSTGGNTKPCSLSKVNITDSITFTTVMKKLIREDSPILYIKASNPNYSNVPGYLVDEDYYKYSPTTTYYANREYYSIYDIQITPDESGAEPTVEISKNEENTYGVDPTYEFVPANTEYELKSGEWLAIYFKDSDSNVHAVVYTDSKKLEWINKIEQDPVYYGGHIKFNFDLYNSKVWHNMGSGHSYVKTDIADYFGKEYKTALENEGMFSLGASDEIEPREKLQVTFDEDSGAILKCYWYTNEPKSTLTFTENGDGNYERILDADEYFFYTNDAEMILVTYGSGTILTLSGGWGSGDSIVWALPEDEENSLNTDEVASKGIGAFADVNWQIKSINNDKTLTICEASIVNLGEGDTLKNLKLIVESGESDDLSTSWKKVDTSSTVLYNGSNKLTAGLDWRVRSILNLNIGPSCIQTLTNTYSESGDTEALISESIEIYTSRWYYLNDPGKKVYVDPVNTNKSWSELTEERLGTPIEKFENISLKANYLVQRSGGNLLSMHRYNTDKTEVDDLLIIPFIKEDCELVYKDEETTKETREFNDNYNKLNLNTLKYLSLPINLKKDKFGMISFYYTPYKEDGASTDGPVHICVYPAGDHDSTRVNSDASVRLYSDMGWVNPVESGESALVYELQPGLNCLRVDNAAYVIIHPIWTGESGEELKHGGTLVFTQMSVINSKDTESGVDYKLLGLQKDTSETPETGDDCNEFLKDYIVENKNFFYNAPIANDDRIDVDTMDPSENNYLGWQNVNNVCNKFTIAELDVDSFEDIQIARPSRK